MSSPRPVAVERVGHLHLELLAPNRAVATVIADMGTFECKSISGYALNSHQNPTAGVQFAGEFACDLRPYPL